MADSVIVDLKQQGVKDLIDNLGLASKGLSELDKGLIEANKQLSTLDKGSDEFKKLSKEINAANTAIDAFAQNTDSLKRELTDTNNEIGKLDRAIKALEKTNQTGTQSYKNLVAEQENLKKKAGELTNAVKNLNEEIKTSGSDTKNLDKALRAIGAVAAGYQVAQGALALFGSENKKFEQALLKLNAVMAITNGLQQIQAELSRKDSIFTQAATKAKALYTAVTSGATVAVNAFRLALAAIGFGVAIAAIVLLVNNWEKLKEAIGLSTISLDDYNKQAEKTLELEEKIQKVRDLSRSISVLLGLKKEKESERESVQDLIDDYNKLDEAYIKQSDKLKKLKSSFSGGFFKSLFGQSREEAIEEQEKIVNEIVIKRGEALEKTLLATKVFNEKIDNDNKKIADEEKKKREKREQEEKQRLEKIRVLNNQYNQLAAEAVIEAAKLEKERTDKNLKSFEDAEKRKQEAAKETNEILQILYNEQVIANKINLQKIQDDLFESNVLKQRDYEDDVEADKKAKEDKIAIAVASSNALFSIAQGISDFRKQVLDNELASGIISEKKYQEELRKLKREEAIMNKAQAAFNITISIAEAIVKALTEGPLIGQILAGITAGLGFAQLAFVLATPIPKFKHGGKVGEHGLLKGKSHEQGGVIVEAERDEYFMPTEPTKKYINHLEAMRKGNYDDFIQKNKFEIPKIQKVFNPDIFANIPNPATIDSSIFMDKDDYSSINSRLDKVASELWWLTNETKKGNKLREKGTEKMVKAVQSKSKRYV